MPSKKPALSETAANSEAQEIVRVLRETPDNIAAATDEFKKRFPPAARKKILERIRALLQRDGRPVPEDSLRIFVSGQLKGVPANQLTQLLPGMLALSSLVSTTEPARTLYDLLKNTAEKGKTAGPAADTLRPIGVALAKLEETGGLLAATLEYGARQGTVTPGFLERLHQLLVPWIAECTRTGSPKSEESSRISTVLRSLDIGVLPDELLVSLPSLDVRASEKSVQVVHAGGESASPAPATPVTQKLHRPSPPAADPARKRLDREELRSALNALFDQIDSLQRDVGTLNRRLGERERIAQELRDELETSSKRAADLDAEAMDLKGQVQVLNAQVQDLEGKREDWVREASRWDQDMDAKLKSQEEELVEKARRMLSKPVANLKDHVVALLKDEDRSRQAAMLATAFDSLHRNVLAFLQEPGDSRIPQDLIRTASGGATGGRQD